MKILCLCGKSIGYEVGKYLLGTSHTLRFVVNDYEKAGEWYRTPRELPIQEIAEHEVGQFAPDLIIVAFYDKILKGEMIFRAPLGTWNIHLGDAERYRGAYPNIWALRNGDTSYAVTLHRIDTGVDTGPLLVKKEFPVPSDWTGRDLYDHMVQEGKATFIAAFDDLVSGRALEKTRPQCNTHAVTHYRRELSRELQVTDAFKNQVRALTFSPFPPPFFWIGPRKFVVVPEDGDIDTAAP